MAGVSYIGNLRSAPLWAKDYPMGRECIMPFPALLNVSSFTNAAGPPVVVGSAGAAAGATTVPVAAINFASTTLAATTLIAQNQTVIPAGTTLTFGPSGTKFAVTTADAVYGATTLSVLPLPTALVSGDTAIYSRYGGVFVPSGTFIGRTAAQQTAGTGFHPAITSGGTVDTELYLTLFDIVDITVEKAATVYRPKSRVAINYLPNYSNLLSTDLAALNSLYQCFPGVD